MLWLTGREKKAAVRQPKKKLLSYEKPTKQMGDGIFLTRNRYLSTKIIKSDGALLLILPAAIHQYILAQNKALLYYIITAKQQYSDGARSSLKTSKIELKNKIEHLYH